MTHQISTKTYAKNLILKKSKILRFPGTTVPESTDSPCMYTEIHVYAMQTGCHSGEKICWKKMLDQKIFWMKKKFVEKIGG